MSTTTATETMTNEQIAAARAARRAARLAAELAAYQRQFDAANVSDDYKSRVAAANAATRTDYGRRGDYDRDGED